MKDAACTNKQDIFFDETKRTTVSQAVKICGSCPVKDLCLQHAIDNRELGIWGGMTTNQRAKMMRKKRASRMRSELLTCSNVPSHGAEEE